MTATSLDDKVAQLFKAGWNGVGNVNDVWNRTATIADGGQQPNPTTPAPAAPAPAAPGAPAAPVAAATDPDAAGKAQMAKASQDYANAIASGNKAAADEAIREFNLGHDLSVAAVTGTFQGNATQAAQQQAANIAATQAGLTGTYNGSPTLAAEKQASDLANQQWTQQQSEAAAKQAAQQQAYAQAIGSAALTGTYAAPSTYAPGTWLSDPKTGQFGQVGANGQVTTYANQQAAMAAGLSTAQPTAQSTAPVPQAPNMPTLADFANQSAATQATYAQYNGGAAGGAAKWLQDATAAVKAASGQAAPAANMPTLADFANQPAATQATYAQYNGGAAGGAAKWLADATAAVQAAGGGGPTASSVGNAVASAPSTSTPSAITTADASTWGGTGVATQTQAAQQQAYQQALDSATQTGFTANGQATVQEQQLGLDALKAQATLQSDPFRQQQYQYGLAAGGYSKAIDAMNGATGFATSQGGQGPSAAGTNTLAYLGGQINQYDPSHMAAFYANTMGGTNGSPMGTGTSTYNASLNALPGSANQIVGANYLKADKATQDFITSGMSAKTGLDQATIDAQIKKTMPGFNAPSFGLTNV
jgi:hypothetical protein